MEQDAAYHRAYRIKSGRLHSLRIPVTVLAAVIRHATASPLVEHLGPQMVQAIREAPVDE